MDLNHTTAMNPITDPERYMALAESARESVAGSLHMLIHLAYQEDEGAGSVVDAGPVIQGGLAGLLDIATDHEGCDFDAIEADMIRLLRNLIPQFKMAKAQAELGAARTEGTA